ncbi:hypothetical protein PVAG01_11098 [Phlyctema vagabunda]|uniref:Uncharacterized protein n=1 Tax=Phlyctema vagabunda TaxID=108571 RepID=A0ABR4P1C9_9HELO
MQCHKIENKPDKLEGLDPIPDISYLRNLVLQAQIIVQHPHMMSTENMPPRPPRSAWVIQLLAKRAQPAGNSTYVKRGAAHKIQKEVEAIDFVRQHTSIPVPWVVKIFIEEDPDAVTSWFSMKTVPGSSLSTAWAEMSVTARSRTTAELRAYLLEMRNLPPRNPSCIGSCSGGPAYDERLNNGFPCGPFTSESESNDYLVAPVAKCPKKELVAHYR